LPGVVNVRDPLANDPIDLRALGLAMAFWA
jgi:hypothetical protein